MTIEFIDAPAASTLQGVQGPPTVGIEFSSSSELICGPSVVTTTRYFQMRGRDQTCPAGQQPAWVEWVVSGSADATGAQATVGDLICGTDPSTDLVEIHVAASW